MLVINPAEDQRYRNEWDAGWALNEQQIKDEIAEMGHEPYGSDFDAICRARTAEDLILSEKGLITSLHELLWQYEEELI